MASLGRTSYDTVNDVRLYFDIVPDDNNVEDNDECNYTDPLHRSGQRMPGRSVTDQIQQSTTILNGTNTNNNKTNDVVTRKKNVLKKNNNNFHSILKNDILLSSPNPSIDGISSTRSPLKKQRRPSNFSSLSNFLFGFMYDDDSENDEYDGYYSDESIDRNNNTHNIRNSSKQQYCERSDIVLLPANMNSSLTEAGQTTQRIQSISQNPSFTDEFYDIHSINESISHETNLKQVKLHDKPENISINIELSQPTPNGYKYRLNYFALCTTLLLQSLVCCLPVALVNPMSNEFSNNNHNNTTTINRRLDVEYQNDGSRISNHKQSSTYFVSQVTAASVLGTSCGKLVNGPTVDIVGARRSSIRNSIFLCVAFVLLAIAQSPQTAIHSCFLVEFANSVQWPCNVVLLSSHTSLTQDFSKNDTSIKPSNDDDEQVNETKLYNNGIFITVLASRCGSLIGIPLWSYCIRLLLHQSTILNHLQGSLSAWRLLAGFGAWIALVTTSITYLYIHDTPHYTNHSSNPVDPKVLYQVRQKWNDLLTALNGQQRHLQRSSSLHDASPLFDETYDNIDDAAVSDRKLGGVHRKNITNTFFSIRIRRRRFIAFIYTLVRAGISILRTNIVPSVVHVTRNGVFWIIALAHSGSSMVKSSERIIATYLLDTNVDGTLQQSTASSLSVFLSIGIVFGLLIAGKVFSVTTNPRERKYIISRLYLLTIVSLYILALLGISSIRTRVPSTVLLRLQLSSIIMIGFGIAVQCYHIPSIVGAMTFTKPYQGLFASYVDGVAYGLSSFVWRIVGNTVHPISTSSTISLSTNSGWAYGWATVALLVVLSAILMIEFIEHYMCRRYYHSMLIHNKNEATATTVDLLGIPTLDHKDGDVGNTFRRRANCEGTGIAQQQQHRRNVSRWGGRFETILLA